MSYSWRNIETIAFISKHFGVHQSNPAGEAEADSWGTRSKVFIQIQKNFLDGVSALISNFSSTASMPDATTA
jgi:hypothetical protein